MVCRDGRAIAGTLSWVGVGKPAQSWVSDVLRAEKRVDVRPPRGDCSPAASTMGRSQAESAPEQSFAGIDLASSMSPGNHDHADRPRDHVPDSLACQENTLLTVEDLQHQYHDEVTLITGPAEGPEGGSIPTCQEAGAQGRSDVGAGRPIRPGNLSEGLHNFARRSGG